MFRFQHIYNREGLAEIETECRRAGIGCVQCKGILAGKLAEAMAPIYEKRQKLSSRPGLLNEILAEGNKRARTAARATMELVREAMHL